MLGVEASTERQERLKGLSTLVVHGPNCLKARNSIWVILVGRHVRGGRRPRSRPEGKIRGVEGERI